MIYKSETESKGHFEGQSATFSYKTIRRCLRSWTLSILLLVTFLWVVIPVIHVCAVNRSVSVAHKTSRPSSTMDIRRSDRLLNTERMDGRDRDDELNERLLQLRRSRGGHGADFTKKLNSFKLSCQTGGAADCLAAYEALQVAYLKYCDKDAEYTSLAPSCDKEDYSHYTAEMDWAKSELASWMQRGPGSGGVPSQLDNMIRPEDSVSQPGTRVSHSGSCISKVSTASSAMAMAAAKRAGLKAKMESVLHQQELEYRMLKMKADMDMEVKKLDHEITAVKMQSELAAATAEEETLTKFLGTVSGSNVNDVTNVKTVKHGSVLNMNSVPGVSLFQQSPPGFGPLQLQSQVPVGVTVNGPNPADSSQFPMTNGTYTTPLNPLAPVWSSPITQPCDVPYQQQLIDTMSLPKVSMMTFDGDPMRYPMFMNAFDSTVGRARIDDSLKLSRLFEYVKGKAARVIEPCALMVDPSEAYQRARQLLAQRFGNEYRISEAWVKSVTTGDQIEANQSGALQDFADNVRGCVETLRSLRKVDEIDTRARMVQIVNKLPRHLQVRWRKIAVGELDVYGHYPSIDRLVAYLDQVSREATDPVFGVLEEPTRAKHDKKQKYDIKRKSSGSYGNKGSSFSVQAGSTDQAVDSGTGNQTAQVKDSGQKSLQCFACKGNHRLSTCATFHNMAPSKRLELVRSTKLCYNCLNGKNHMVYECRLRSQCDIQGCTGKHSKYLHHGLEQARQAKQTTMKTVETAQSTEVRSKGQSSVKSTGATSCACGDSGASGVALPIVKVCVRGHGLDQSVITHALLDPGSNKSFCSAQLMAALELHGKQTTLNLETLNCGSSSEVCEVALDVTSVLGKSSTRKTVHLPHVFSLEKFPDLNDSVFSAGDADGWEHLRDLEVPIMINSTSCPGVSLLIGQDVPQALVPLEIRQGGENEPYAVRTVLGWSISGPVGRSSQGSGNAIVNFISAAPSTDHDLSAQVERFWRLDYGPDLCQNVPEMSVDDHRVMNVWNRTTKVVDNHYVMEIPFKKEEPDLPDNKSLAEKRLKGLERRLRKDPELHARYHGEVVSLIEKGYAEPVLSDVDPEPGLVWYLPHHPVLNPNKPGKLRIVFDCAAKYAGTCLNQHISQGPDLTNKLVGVLLRFRRHKVGMMSDIQAMFHQVVVAEHQRDVLRFLWWPEGNMDVPPLTYRMTVHLFGGVWSPSCAGYALRRTAEDHRDKFSSSAVQCVLRNTYVDDCLRDENTDEAAVETATELRQLLACGGFHLTKWASNSQAVLDSVPEQDRLSAKKSLDFDKSMTPTERALGVLWNISDDTLGVKIKLKEAPRTRRGMLSTLSSVYDPLGMVAPCVLLAKRLFQEEVKTGKGWDDKLGPGVCVKWSEWLQELPQLEHFKLPRCVGQSEFLGSISTELHHFCDASQAAYGTVSYVRIVSDRGDVQCSFLCAKSRLAPIKTVTIPRLELLAATLAVKVDAMLRRELDIDDVKSCFWTDSMIVLQYIGNTTRRFQTFVANRVAAIHDGSEPSQWRHVPTGDNPADDSSRGLHAAEMVANVRWLRGPEFLWNEESAWPVSPEGVPDLLSNDKEVKSEALSFAASGGDRKLPFEELLCRYSSWLRLTKAVAWLLKFKQWLQAGDQSAKASVTGITVDDLQAAERAVVRFVQQSSYKEELQALSGGKKIQKQSPIYRLEPRFGADGVLRVGGRLQMAPLDDEAKHPAILPRDHHATTLIVRDAHERATGHSGREHVVATVRQQFWVPRCRTLVNRVLRECVVCKKSRGLLSSQRMADLPLDRVTPGQAPFSCVGIDCFGPFLVKRGRSQEKRYGCLFTCLAIRAIHIEKLHTMESDSFLNALMRFVARRGIPDKIRSDNGTNFTGGNRELSESILEWERDTKVRGQLMSMRIRWEFNPPAASHMGGVWERQIRTVRKVLSSILKDQVLDDERLDTVLCQAEGIVNSRPLTAVSSDPQDPKPLTPNDLLLLRGHAVAPPGKFLKTDVYSRRWRHVQYLADQFWRRWLREYLPTLQLRGKWLEKKQNASEGDVVLVTCENTPRNCWPLGRITKVFPGKDGLVRSVEVQTAWSDPLVRPVDKLCPLGINFE